jgi:hypothetical protein
LAEVSRLRLRGPLPEGEERGGEEGYPAFHDSD